MLIELNNLLNEKLNLNDNLDLILNNKKNENKNNNLETLIQNNFKNLNKETSNNLINNIQDLKNQNDIKDNINKEIKYNEEKIHNNKLKNEEIDLLFKIFNFCKYEINLEFKENNANEFNKNLKKINDGYNYIINENKLFINILEMKEIYNNKINYLDYEIENFINNNLKLNFNFIRFLEIPKNIKIQVLKLIFNKINSIEKFDKEIIIDLINIIEFLKQNYTNDILQIYSEFIKNNFKKIKKYIQDNNEIEFDEIILKKLLSLKYNSNFEINKLGKKYFNLKLVFDKKEDELLIEFKNKFTNLIDNDLEEIKIFYDYLLNLLKFEFENKKNLILIFSNIIIINEDNLKFNENNISKFILLIQLFKEFSIDEENLDSFYNLCNLEMKYLKIQNSLINF